MASRVGRMGIVALLALAALLALGMLRARGKSFALHKESAATNIRAGGAQQGGLTSAVQAQQPSPPTQTQQPASAKQQAATNIRADVAQRRGLAAATQAAPVSQTQQQFSPTETQQPASAKRQAAANIRADGAQRRELAAATQAAPAAQAQQRAVEPRQQTGEQALAEQRAVKKYRVAAAREPKLTRAQIDALLRRKIKYVFVLYQENRSFDSYFGTFPGAEGIFSHAAKDTPGFYQPLTNTDGTAGTIHPFRIGPKQFAADTDDVDHSHPMIVAKMDIAGGAPRMDRFAIFEEAKRVKKSAPGAAGKPPVGGKPTLAGKQMGELAMAYEDCDTIPFLWRYADRFVLFDHIFQEMTGPSTLGNLSIIAAQTGQTQWALHPNEAYKDNGSHAPGVPVLNDNDPFWGSQLDKTPQAQKMPVNPHDMRNGVEYGTAINLTFASLPLTLLGEDAKTVAKWDAHPRRDLADVKNDIPFIASHDRETVPFGWYQEGYGKGPTDRNGGADDDDGPLDAFGLHASYVTHHNGPQYFGYVANNPKIRAQLHGLQDFFNALDKKTLPRAGGVFFVKGGFQNLFHLKPSDPDAKVRKKFLGDDDHPGYSDAQISEAMLATAINKIAASPYWSESAIIVTWDDSEGDYDHVPPPIRAKGPDGSPISDGPRVPLILISPYARTHYIAHAAGNHASVVKFIDTVFHRTPLALLPDEQRGRALGEKEFGQSDLGPQDALTPGVTDLADAFSPSRLLGKSAPLPPAYVEIPDSLVRRLPAETGYGCSALGIVTTDRRRKIVNAIPRDFNPRPLTNPSK
ncbi:MAG: phospholipase C [Candidatus Acidiferrales bacterium]